MTEGRGNGLQNRKCWFNSNSELLRPPKARRRWIIKLSDSSMAEQRPDTSEDVSSSLTQTTRGSRKSRCFLLKDFFTSGLSPQ
jgi:hypothetical protein